MSTLLKALFEPRAMTRCECADLPFEEIRRRIERGQSFDEIAHRTGCGRTCTACVPDLQAFLEQQGAKATPR
ncbi:MAG TPA: (2Fe-2S)-binding protein [Vicinamibacteria bacterium]|nr:(2Fe-2S)-binding protein [Vicinamibacteria bacterium]